MKLQDWLTQKNMTANDFAPLIMVARGTVYAWLAGKSKPTKHMRWMIQQATNSKVKPKDWDND